MKYRHQYHAGNFADVHKHVLLLEVLRALTRKDKGLLFVDTHAGRGEYDLHPGDSEHPAEWQAGAAKLLAAAPHHAALTRYRFDFFTGVPSSLVEDVIATLEAGVGAPYVAAVREDAALGMARVPGSPAAVRACSCRTPVSARA